MARPSARPDQGLPADDIARVAQWGILAGLVGARLYEVAFDWEYYGRFPGKIKFLLLGHSVDHLLEDNHYRRVDEPSAGDVIIYRDELGEIVHSGIVRGLLNDVTVVVESKFGIGGRYLHLPEDQPYSTHFDFYRSSRAQSVANVTAPTSPDLADCVADDCVRCELHAKIQAAPSPPATKVRLATGAD